MRAAGATSLVLVPTGLLPAAAAGFTVVTDARDLYAEPGYWVDSSA
jgi:hypothetical protein